MQTAEIIRLIITIIVTPLIGYIFKKAVDSNKRISEMDKSITILKERDGTEKERMKKIEEEIKEIGRRLEKHSGEIAYIRGKSNGKSEAIRKK